MQPAALQDSTSLAPIAIAVAVAVLAIAVGVLRRVRGERLGGTRFPPHRAPPRAMALIATLAAVIAGLTVVLESRRRGAVVAESLQDPASASQWMWVTIVIGAVAVVAVLVFALRERDEGA